MRTLDELLGGSGQGGQQLQQGVQAHGVSLGGLLASPAARAALGGIAAMVVRQVQRRR